MHPPFEEIGSKSNVLRSPSKIVRGDGRATIVVLVLIHICKKFLPLVVRFPQEVVEGILVVAVQLLQLLLFAIGIG